MDDVKIEITNDQLETIRDLEDVAYAYWIMLNSAMRHAQLAKDIPSIIKFTNEIKAAHGIVATGLRLLSALGTQPKSFNFSGDLSSKPEDKPMDDQMPPSPIIKPPGY